MIRVATKKHEDRGYAIPGQRIDLIVENAVLVELKATTRIEPVLESKVISYLRTTGLRWLIFVPFVARVVVLCGRSRRFPVSSVLSGLCKILQAAP